MSASGIGAIFILDRKGRAIISRTYRGNIPVNTYDVFNKMLLEFDEFSIKPILKDK